MTKPCIPVLLMLVFAACSTQRPGAGQSSTIKIDVSEDNLAVHARNIRFDALVNAINGATGVYRWETVMEFDPEVAARIVSMDFDGYRSMCTIVPALEKVGLCRFRRITDQHWAFKHEDAQPEH